MIEKEYKWLVSEWEFEVLLGYMRMICPDEQVIEQQNYYYDSAQYDLFHQGITLRVRKKDGGYSLQTKQTNSLTGGLRVAKETKCSIASLPLIVTAAAVGLPMDYHFDLLGSLVTTRHRFEFEHDYRLDCDENVYCGVKDYEIELEFGEQAMVSIPPILQHKTLNQTSKYARFLLESCGMK